MPGPFTKISLIIAFNTKYFWLNILGEASAGVVNKSFQVTIPANDGVSFLVGGLEQYNQYELIGNFDVQVDFNLIAWPFGNWVSAGIIMPNFTVARYSPGNVDQYIIFFAPDQKWFNVNTSDLQGKLRLNRTGNTVSGYYWQNNGWQLIGSDTNSQFAGPAGGYIGGLSGGSGNPTKTVTAAFNNYRITNAVFPSGLAPLSLLLEN